MVEVYTALTDVNKSQILRTTVIIVLVKSLGYTDLQRSASTYCKQQHYVQYMIELQRLVTAI